VSTTSDRTTSTGLNKLGLTLGWLGLGLDALALTPLFSLANAIAPVFTGAFLFLVGAFLVLLSPKEKHTRRDLLLIRLMWVSFALLLVGVTIKLHGFPS